jgi:hypothetical protein
LFLGKPNVWKMHYKIERCHQFAVEDGRDFDLFIRLRPDIEIVGDETIDWWQIHERACQERLVFTDLPLRYVHNKLEIGDQFCATTRDIMDVYASVQSQMDTFRQAGSFPFGVPSELRSHEQLAMLTLYKGILSEQPPLLRKTRLLDPSMPSVGEILSLLKQDLEAREGDGFDGEFLEACERFA